MYYNFFKVTRVALFLAIQICSHGVLSQSNERVQDSLEEQLATVTLEEDRLKILIELSVEYFDVDNSTAIEKVDEAYRLAKHLGDTLHIVKAARIKSQLLRRTDQLDQSIELLMQIYPIAKRNNLKEEYKRILNALALAYTFKANYDKALQFNFESLVVREQEGDKAQISIALNNIGLVYFKLKNYERAIAYYTRSLELKKEANDVYDLDMLLINLGLCFNQIAGNPSKYLRAQEYFQQALTMCKEPCTNQVSIAANFGLGVSFFGMNELHQAQDHFLKSLQFAQKVNDKRWQLENLVYLARIATIRKDEDQSKTYLSDAESIAKETEYNLLLIEIYKEFSILFNQSNDFQKAAFYQEKYISLKDSVFSESLIKNLSQIQSDYAERENIATIASKEKVIKQQRELNTAVAVIAILAGLLILVLQRSNRTIKRVNVQLSEAKEVIQDQNQLLENKNKYLDKEVESKTADLERANQSLKQVNDELDNFIYKTSHDIRGPLASLKGMCNVALMDVTDPVALDYLKKLDSTAERLNTILTRLLIINQINNSKLSLTKIDFSTVVKDVILLEQKKGLPQNLSFRLNIEDNSVIHSDKELVRIVLENLIDNAIKFYNDSDRVESFVEINVATVDKNGVKVRVVDNGIGISESNPGKLFRMFFRASERSETGGIGLYIVKTATSKLGGRVGLLTTPEGFTEFYVTFPAYPPNREEPAEKPRLYS